MRLISIVQEHTEQAAPNVSMPTPLNSPSIRLHRILASSEAESPCWRWAKAMARLVWKRTAARSNSMGLRTVLLTSRLTGAVALLQCPLDGLEVLPPRFDVGASGEEYLLEM